MLLQGDHLARLSLEHFTVRLWSFCFVLWSARTPILPGHGEGSLEDLPFPRASVGNPVAVPYSWYAGARLFVTAHAWLLLHPSIPRPTACRHHLCSSAEPHELTTPDLSSSGLVGSLCSTARLGAESGASWPTLNAVAEGDGSPLQTPVTSVGIAACTYLFTISSHAC